MPCACRFLQFATLSVFLISGISWRSAAQETQSVLSLTPEQQGVVASLAQSIQQEIKREDCAGTGCEILVVNLVLPSGDACPACILLADSLAKTLSELPGAPNVIPRASLGSFLDEQRIPSKLLYQHETLAWVGHELHASRVVFGTIKAEKDLLELKAQVLKDETFVKGTHASKEMKVRMPLGNLADGLSARESFHPLEKRDLSLTNAVPLNASFTAQKNTKLPSCPYMPSPRYTQAAREAKLSGSLIVEAIVTRQGKVINPRIVRGLPFGLNENSLETLTTWRCNPALQNGEPLAVMVPFEVTFRLY
jgi:TonB family protein